MRSLLALLGALCVLGTQHVQSQLPDIVLILVDDMGFSDIGCYGGEIETPNIDSLASKGVRFAQFYNSGRCCPTRATLMTGLHPHQAGIGHMTLAPNVLPQENTPANYQGYLNENCVTIAEVLGQNHYATLMTGKWHLGMHDPKLWPAQRGFSKYFGSLAGATRFFFPKHPRGMTADNERIVDPKSTTNEAFYTTDAFTDHAIRFIGDHAKSEDSENPFFLYLAYTAPHWPLQAFEDDVAKYRGKYIDGWEKLRATRYKRQVELGLINPDWKLSDATKQIPKWDTLSGSQKQEMDLKMAVYAAMIDRIDQNIGKLIGELKSLKRFENTLIMFLSDNGGCAEGGMLGRGPFENPAARNQSDANSYGEAWANASCTPFRLYKHFAHEGGTATPFIMHWPNEIHNQTDWYHEPAQLIDIMPTVLDVADAKYPTTFNDKEIVAGEGISLRPAFSGQPIPRTEPIFIEHENNAFVRAGKWKLVGHNVAPPDGVDQKKWELYDMMSDRTETNDLAASNPQKVSELAKRWDDWAERVGVFPKPQKRKPRGQKRSNR